MVLGKKHLFYFLFFVIAINLLSKIVPNTTPHSSNTAQKKPVVQTKKAPSPKKAVKPPVENASEIEPETLKMRLQMAVNVIKGYDMVRDAAYSRDGDTYSLAIIVDYAASEEYAKELGERFVRGIKSFGDDFPPDIEIGKGKYNYIISVFYPSKKEIVTGAKVTVATKITW